MAGGTDKYKLQSRNRGGSPEFPIDSMGLLNLNRLMSTKRRRRRQIEARKGSIALRAKTKASPSQHGENSIGNHIKGYSWWAKLPKDMWWHIHSLMPMRDAAQIACLSQDFVRSWRYHPNLTFSEETLGLNENTCQNEDKVRCFTNRVNRIMKKHSGIGVKTFKLELRPFYNNEDCCHLDHLDSWLQVAVKPGIKELDLSLSPSHRKYNFPCSLLSGGTGDSLCSLVLVACNFYPTVRSCCLRSLTRLKLYAVHISEDTLRCIFSSSCALEWLELRHCNSIICLKIPCLQQLSYLGVSFCAGLQVIESKAPNLNSFRFDGGRHVQLSIGNSLRIKELNGSCIDAILYARTELPSGMPNLETLTICSESERFSTPMMPSRFLHLKFLSITLCGLGYDLFSLVSFLHASPSLETFILCVLREGVERVSVLAEPSGLRMVHNRQYDKLKSVKIINFSSAKELVELTCHILESAKRLERLTLDTTSGAPRCSVSKSGKCLMMHREALVEAHRAVLAVHMYIKLKGPSKVELNVLEPCSQCHSVRL